MKWKPHVKQVTFLQAVASGEYDEVGYGGSRGGGKTDAGIMSLLYNREHEMYRALVIRKNADDLRDWGDRADRWYQTMLATRVGNPPDFTFPAGAKIRTGHLKDSNAFSKYQGHEYHKILIEELTQIAREEDYLKLKASCRSTMPDELKPCTISTFNPDGPGFAWVKRRFRLEGIPQQPVITIDPVTGLKRIFIPARLEDNPDLARDGAYRSFLDGLPDGLRQAWRDGSWDEPIIGGAFYTQELTQARRERRIKIVPYDPKLRVHTVWDLGSAENSMALLFVQRTKDETRIINSYSSSVEFGLNHYYAKMQEYQRQFGYVYGQHFAPHDAKRKEVSSGKTIVQTAKEMGLVFTRVPMLGIADGIQRVRLMFPRLFVHEVNCEQFLTSITNYRRPWNENLLKYGDEPLHDWASHFADVLRYLAVVENEMMNADRGPKVEAAWNYQQPKNDPVGWENNGRRPRSGRGDSIDLPITG